MPPRSVILIADDDESSVLLLEMAFKKARISYPLRAVRNGQQAIDYLSGEGVYADRKDYPWPALMLLDVKMPLLDGFDVLSWWHEQAERRELPIVVMSSSNREEDVTRAMDLGATAYRVKPSEFQQLVEVAHELKKRWLRRRRQAVRNGRTRKSGASWSAERI